MWKHTTGQYDRCRIKNKVKNESLQDADNAASDSSARVPSLPGVRVVWASKVVGLLVEYQTTAEDAVGADERDQVVDEVDAADASLIKLNVTEVADMAVLVVGVAMLFL